MRSRTSLSPYSYKCCCSAEHVARERVHGRAVRRHATCCCTFAASQQCCQGASNCTRPPAHMVHRSSSTARCRETGCPAACLETAVTEDSSQVQPGWRHVRHNASFRSTSAPHLLLGEIVLFVKGRCDLPMRGRSNCHGLHAIIVDHTDQMDRVPCTTNPTRHRAPFHELRSVTWRTLAAHNHAVTESDCDQSA